MASPKHRLVFGLGAGVIYTMGQKGTWREFWPKYLQNFENDFLFSAKDCPYTFIEFTKQYINPEERFYLDSGGFTLFKEEKKYGKDNPIFHKKCESMKRRLLKILSLMKPKVVFELDNEYFRHDEDIMSPKNYCREEIKALTGEYPVPVFKMHQGFAYWKQLCDSDVYPKLAIGGLAQTRSWHTMRDEIKTMMDYARSKGKKVHLLGCQNIETFKTVQPDTVDYCIYQVAINLIDARKEHPEWPEKMPFAEIGKHAVMWGFARAKVRSHFYDSFQITEEE